MFCYKLLHIIRFIRVVGAQLCRRAQADPGYGGGEGSFRDQ